MDRRDFLKAIGITATAITAGSLNAKINAKKSLPNVIVIQPDQHCGLIMGCAGDKHAKTPNLDRMAAEGIHFTRCVSASPVCSPFRGTMQTGLYPHKHGVTNNGKQLDPNLKCFAEVFEKAGYATGYIGKWHLDGLKPIIHGGEGVSKKAVGGFVVPQRRQGWREWNGYEKSHEYFEVWKYDVNAKKIRVKEYDWEPTWHTDMALDFIRRNKAAGKPSLYYIAYGPPHKPEQCTDEFLNMYDAGQFQLPLDLKDNISSKWETVLRKAIQVYYGQVTAIDHEIGRLIKGLKEMGEDDNTIILYTSDHGDRLGSHWAREVRAAGNIKKPEKGKSKKVRDVNLSLKNMRGKSSPYQKAFRIPFIVRWPAKIKAGLKCDELVSSVDLTPTILELAGMDSIEEMQGDSMAGWCLNGKGPRNEAVWIGLGQWRAAWDGRYVYARGDKFNHLFDHERNPHELNNLLESPKHQKQVKRMHELLLKLAKRVEDPMLVELRKINV